MSNAARPYICSRFASLAQEQLITGPDSDTLRAVRLPEIKLAAGRWPVSLIRRTPDPGTPALTWNPAAQESLTPRRAMIPLKDAVQAGHAEGFWLGAAVARDAPTRWVEAVIAGKPRIPSDLQARPMEGSHLSAEALRHDDVRHALQRGFWDGLERSFR